MRTDVDIAIAAVMRERYGIATIDELRDAGCKGALLTRRVRSGALLRLGPGVFADPAVPPSFEQRALAAVLAAGAGSFASHETAAQLWGLPLPYAAALEYTTVLERSPTTAGVRRHRSSLIADHDHTTVRGIPVATPERTIVDLSSRVDARVLGKLADDALHRRITTLVRIESTALRLPAAPGRSPKKVAELVARRRPGERESHLEDFVFDALHRFGLPLPVCQHGITVGGRPRRIDCCFPDAMLALEIQGFAAHGRRSQFDRDAVRGNELLLLGFRVLQFTSAFTDRKIARQVAAALGLPEPVATGKARSFADWQRRLVAT